MDAVKFFKEKERMCSSIDKGNKFCKCDNCGLSYKNNETGLNCDEFQRLFPWKAVQIVQEWSEKNPEKTILDDLLEKYPNVPMREDGTPTICAIHIGYVGKYRCKEVDCDCKLCWSMPLSEVKHE